MFVDPITPIDHYGPAIGAVILCAGLFIWQQVNSMKMQDLIEKHVDDDATNFAAVRKDGEELKELVASTVSSQEKMAMSINHLAEAVKQQAEVHSEQLAELRANSKDTAKLIENQTMFGQSFQKLVDKLISRMGD
jgi:hypothetical protein